MDRPRTIADTLPQSEELRGERPSQHLSRITLSIYALSKKSIDDVLKDIEYLIREYITDKVLDSPQDQENIGKLKPQQVKKIIKASLKANTAFSHPAIVEMHS